MSVSSGWVLNLSSWADILNKSLFVRCIWYSIKIPTINSTATNTLIKMTRNAPFSGMPHSLAVFPLGLEIKPSSGVCGSKGGWSRVRRSGGRGLKYSNLLSLHSEITKICLGLSWQTGHSDPRPENCFRSAHDRRAW